MPYIGMYMIQSEWNLWFSLVRACCAYTAVYCAISDLLRIREFSVKASFFSFFILSTTKKKEKKTRRLNRLMFPKSKYAKRPSNHTANISAPQFPSIASQFLNCIYFYCYPLRLSIVYLRICMILFIIFQIYE